jgi:hypothetical protein
MGASFFHGHPRARRLKGVKILDEFDWCESYTEILSQFAMKAETGLAFADRYPWPERPKLPTRARGNRI